MVAIILPKIFQYDIIPKDEEHVSYNIHLHTRKIVDISPVTDSTLDSDSLFKRPETFQSR